MSSKTRVLLVGASGFVGSHAYPVLVAEGFDVVCGSRDPGEAQKRYASRPQCHLDLADRATIDAALARVDRAVYLAHAMGESDAYGAVEEAQAEAFRDAAAQRGLERIVYLGGMRPQGEVSRHLRSRLRTGEVLRAGAVPVVELQATMVIGGGSESFRIVRDLAARLPWMLLPKWLESVTEPVAIADVGAAIARALEMPLDGSRVLTAPGPEKVTGKEIILRTARLLGQEPRTLDIPLITPRLSSYWIRLVTRANPDVATELVEGLKSNIVSKGPEIWSEMPGHERVGFDEAVRRALGEEERDLPSSTRLVERVLHGLARP